MGLFATLESVCQHPLNRAAPFAALWRFGRWQISQRVFPRRVVTPWVNGTHLVVGAGETGLTGNVYCGLHEFDDMAFVLHFLRPDDRFIDVGANAGSYTVLAAGAVGASTIAIEPIPATFERLLDNVHVNRLTDRVTCLNCGAGARPAALRFTAGSDTMNHAVSNAGEEQDSIVVPVRTLDEIVPLDRLAFLKIDVEGFETAVLDGAGSLLHSANLLGMLVELNGSGARYGFDDSKVHERLLVAGFVACRYWPFERRLEPAINGSSGNTLYLRDPTAALDRVRNARRFSINDHVL
jgi:FkbM family methyltransferase